MFKIVGIQYSNYTSKKSGELVRQCELHFTQARAGVEGVAVGTARCTADVLSGFYVQPKVGLECIITTEADNWGHLRITGLYPAPAPVPAK